MKKILLFLLLLGVFSSKAQQIEEEDDDNENREKRAQYELRNILPPNSKELPYDTLFKANKNIDTYFRIKKTQPTTNNAIPNINWNEQGPNNIGGRTRAIMFDPTTTNKVWAGGAAGGLWYNNNITSATSSWLKVNDFWENLKITSIARSSASSQIFYVGTGERRPGGGVVGNGGGIWRTGDGGITWVQLPNTHPSVDDNFTYIQKIVVSGTGRVYAACFGGLMFSDDEGNTWSEVTTNFTNTDGNFQNYFDDLEIAPFNIVYATYRNGNTGNSRIIRVSSTNTVTDITPTYAGAGYRIEIALAPSTFGNTLNIYAICIGPVSTTTDVLWFKKTVDAGTTWTNVTAPTYKRNGVGPTLSFTNNSGGNQGDYDLAMAVHPTNANLVIVGGATNGRTTNGGSSWVVDNYFASMHPDIHTVVFSPANNNDALVGNDGGVYLCSGYGDASNASPTFASRNKGYNVTEFYGVALKNIANDNFTLAGAQDNGTIMMQDYSFSDGTDVTGSDGAFCFIDQNNSNIKIVSIQNLNHYLYNETTNTLTNLVNKSDGEGFINPCDYDSQNNIFYTFYKSANGGNYFYRITNIGTTNDTTRFYLGIVGGITSIKVGKSANRIFVGTDNGRLYRANLTNISSTTVTDISQYSTNTTPSGSSNPGGVIYSIDIGIDDNELIMIRSNYNVKSVFYSTNGGTSWISKDETAHGLPNIPIYGALFNPLNRSQVLLATELGIWSTMTIAATNPVWEPTDASLAHVRCLAFAYRSADNLVAVATHGRGVFTTSLTSPCPASRNIVALPQGSAHYEASSTITTAITMPSNATVSFDAGQKVSLKSGFKVKQGTHFKAYIDGCGGVR